MAATERRAVTFNSLAFVGFAAVFFAGWWAVRWTARPALAWSYIGVASLVFYGWWNWKHVVVLVAITLASYGCGRLARSQRRGLVLALALVLALGPLVVWKYSAFAIEQLNALLELFGLDRHVEPLGLAVPLGLSFFTLSAVSYAIDVYTEEIEPEPDVVKHFVFLAMFPILLSGPIVRGGQILPQLARLPTPDAERRWSALKQITYGLVKKCIVADHIANFTEQMFGLQHPPPSSGLWWFVAVMYLIQIYCDFSGYTDIALGLGRWTGLELPENFRHPLLATSIRDFWNRWNISFSTWLRDYIYFPLARRWVSALGAFAAVMITFLVSGLWHGAAWTFVVWGLCHGVLLCVEHLTKWDRRLLALPGGRYLASLVVVLVVSLALIVFRSDSLVQAWEIVRIMFSFESTQVSFVTRDHVSFHEPTWLLLPALFVVIELRHLIDFDSSRLATWIRRSKLGWLAIAVLLLACVYLRGRTTAFIYAGF